MEQFDETTLMKALIAVRGRAERLDGDQIVESFSMVGPLSDLISTADHQVIFGRRGTGKTHALRYLYSKVNSSGDAGVYVDMLNLGSDTSIYNDHSLGIPERATRLLIDALSQIQDGILDYATSGVTLDLNQYSKLLDHFKDAVSQVRIVGDRTVTTESSRVEARTTEASAQLGATPTGILGRFGFGKKENKEEAIRTSTSAQGKEVYAARFPELGAAIRNLIQFLPAPRVWIILDEWSSLPMDLQPFLADLLKRTFFNIQKISVKIGAVEHRTKLLLEDSSGNNFGLEPTADIRTDVRLDDYLLFDNDGSAAVDFFKDFLFRHVRSVCKEKGLPEPESPDQLVSRGFSQKSAFEEFVKSVEGVPRDAIHIAANCAQKAFGRNIDIPTVRQAAHRYYQEDKSSQVEENPTLRELLSIHRR